MRESGEEIDDVTRRQRELSLRLATFKLLSDDIRDHFDWHQHQVTLTELQRLQATTTVGGATHATTPTSSSHITTHTPGHTPGHKTTTFAGTAVPPSSSSASALSSSSSSSSLHATTTTTAKNTTTTTSATTPAATHTRKGSTHSDQGLKHNKPLLHVADKNATVVDGVGAGILGADISNNAGTLTTLPSLFHLSYPPALTPPPHSPPPIISPFTHPSPTYHIPSCCTHRLVCCACFLLMNNPFYVLFCFLGTLVHPPRAATPSDRHTYYPYSSFYMCIASIL